jgi:biopolymer transport protein ExbB
MFEIVKSGGLMMVPLILCSIIAAAIILERLWTLQKSRVVPPELAEKVWRWVETRQIQEKHIFALRQNSPLGKILAAGLANRHRDRAIVKEAIEDTGRHVIHELERYLNALATIAAISPLLGLLGTVFGMIRTFNAISSVGVGDPTALSAGIGEALIATAAGLIVAIPAVIGYRYLRRRVDELVVDMEVEAMKLLRALEEDASVPSADVQE